LLKDIRSGKRKTVFITDQFTEGINKKQKSLFMKFKHAKEDVALYTREVDEQTADIAKWSKENMEFKRKEFANISRNLS